MHPAPSSPTLKAGARLRSGIVAHGAEGPGASSRVKAACATGCGAGEKGTLPEAGHEGIPDHPVVPAQPERQVRRGGACRVPPHGRPRGWSPSPGPRRLGIQATPTPAPAARGREWGRGRVTGIRAGSQTAGGRGRLPRRTTLPLRSSQTPPPRPGRSQGAARAQAACAEPPPVRGGWVGPAPLTPLETGSGRGRSGSWPARGTGRPRRGDSAGTRPRDPDAGVTHAALEGGVPPGPRLCQERTGSGAPQPQPTPPLPTPPPPPQAGRTQRHCLPAGPGGGGWGPGRRRPLPLASNLRAAEAAAVRSSKARVGSLLFH